MERRKEKAEGEREREGEREGKGRDRSGLEGRPNPRCIMPGCGRELAWGGPTVCPEHGGQRAQRTAKAAQEALP